MPAVSIRYKGVHTRVTITPNQTLHEALSQFCAKKRLNASDFALKHRNHGYVSLVTPFRLGKVDSNASLDLVPKPAGASRKPVRVALQTPERKRFQSTFPSSHSLFQILEAIDKENKCNLIGRIGANGIEMVPTVTIATSRRSLTGKDVLQTTTLASLGIQGSTLLRITLAEGEAQDSKDPSKPSAHTGVSGMTMPLKGNKTEASSQAPPDVPKSKAPEQHLLTAGRDQKDVSAKTLAQRSNGQPSNVQGKMKSSIFTVERDGTKFPELSMNNLNQALAKLRSETGGNDGMVAALVTVRHIINNIVTRKGEKFRRLQLKSTKLHSKLGRYQGGQMILESVGFTSSKFEDGTYHILQSEHEDQKFLKEALGIISEEITIAMPPDVEVPDVETSQDDATSKNKPVSMVLENVPEKFDWEEEKDKARRGEEARKKEAEELQRKAQSKLEGTSDIEPMSFDWMKSKDEKSGMQVEEVTPRTDIANPDYNIADVRKALERLRKDYGTDAKSCLQSMKLLEKITLKLQEIPKKTQYRRIKLANTTVQKKIASKPGAMLYLGFIGFEEKEKGILVLPESNERDIKTSRALTMLRRKYQEIEIEVPMFTSEQRCLKIFDASKLNAESFSILPEPKSKSDAQLLVESFREAKLRKALEGKVLERKRLRRRYDKTVIRVVVRPEEVVLQGYFHPNERLLQVFKMVQSALHDKSLWGSNPSVRIPPQQEIKLREHGKMTLDELKLVPAQSLNLFLKPPSGSESVIRKELLMQKVALVAEVIPKPINEAEIQRALRDIVGPTKAPKAGVARTGTRKKKTKRERDLARLAAMEAELGEN